MTNDEQKAFQAQTSALGKSLETLSLQARDLRATMYRASEAVQLGRASDLDWTERELARLAATLRQAETDAAALRALLATIRGAKPCDA